MSIIASSENKMKTMAMDFKWVKQMYVLKTKYPNSNFFSSPPHSIILRIFLEFDVEHKLCIHVYFFWLMKSGGEIESIEQK